MSTVFIFGSRGINDMAVLEEVITASGYIITEVVEGECPNSPDILAKQWAISHGIPFQKFPADWNNLSHPDAVIRVNRFGKKYDAKAGFRRNKEMVEYTKSKNGKAIGIWNQESKGTRDARELVLAAKIPLYLAKR